MLCADTPVFALVRATPQPLTASYARHASLGALLRHKLTALPERGEARAPAPGSLGALLRQRLSAECTCTTSRSSMMSGLGAQSCEVQS
ncbi:hypothetical protein QTH90_00210 [Variovorax sp. J2P1-59]|uniref:hypothetical protein n=1 Tax=Variovorax flavidus TaxID=3053501 RepID=UPI0025767B99|nr:hypothetical protein [Variovorax sp. J2P1-59]MDM0072787.1 hypothetical protein [Variovorax sp. J2P1-59]